MLKFSTPQEERFFYSLSPQQQQQYLQLQQQQQAQAKLEQQAISDKRFIDHARQQVPLIIQQQNNGMNGFPNQIHQFPAQDQLHLQQSSQQFGQQQRQHQQHQQQPQPQTQVQITTNPNGTQTQATYQTISPGVHVMTYSTGLPLKPGNNGMNMHVTTYNMNDHPQLQLHPSQQNGFNFNPNHQNNTPDPIQTGAQHDVNDSTGHIPGKYRSNLMLKHGHDQIIAHYHQTNPFLRKKILDAYHQSKLIFGNNNGPSTDSAVSPFRAERVSNVYPSPIYYPDVNEMKVIGLYSVINPSQRADNNPTSGGDSAGDNNNGAPVEGFELDFDGNISHNYPQVRVNQVLMSQSSLNNQGMDQNMEAFINNGLGLLFPIFQAENSNKSQFDDYIKLMKQIPFIQSIGNLLPLSESVNDGNGGQMIAKRSAKDDFFAEEFKLIDQKLQTNKAQQRETDEDRLIESVYNQQQGELNKLTSQRTPVRSQQRKHISPLELLFGIDEGFDDAHHTRPHYSTQIMSPLGLLFGGIHPFGLTHETRSPEFLSQQQQQQQQQQHQIADNHRQDDQLQPPQRHQNPLFTILFDAEPMNNGPDEQRHQIGHPIESLFMDPFFGGRRGVDPFFGHHRGRDDFPFGHYDEHHHRQGNDPFMMDEIIFDPFETRSRRQSRPHQAQLDPFFAPMGMLFNDDVFHQGGDSSNNSRNERQVFSSSFSSSGLGGAPMRKSWSSSTVTRVGPDGVARTETQEEEIIDDGTEGGKKHKTVKETKVVGRDNLEQVERIETDLERGDTKVVTKRKLGDKQHQHVTLKHKVDNKDKQLQNVHDAEFDQVQGLDEADIEQFDREFDRELSQQD